MLGVVFDVAIDNWNSKLINSIENESSTVRMGRAELGARDQRKMITVHERSESATCFFRIHT